MATLGIRKSAWQGATAIQRTVFRRLGDILELGVPATYQTPGAVEWFVFDDHRFKPKVMAYFASVAANLADWPAGYTVPQQNGEDDLATMRQQVKTWAEDPARTNPLVLPEDVVFPENDPNPWQTLLDANAAPSWLKMGGGVPDNWTPVA